MKRKIKPRIPASTQINRDPIQKLKKCLSERQRRAQFSEKLARLHELTVLITGDSSPNPPERLDVLNNCIALLEKWPQRPPFGARRLELTSPNCQCICQAPLTPRSTNPESVVFQTEVAHNAVAPLSTSPFTPIASNPNAPVTTPDSGCQGSTADSLCLHHSRDDDDDDDYDEGPTNACTNYKSAFKPVVPRKVRMECDNAHQYTFTPGTRRQSTSHIAPFGRQHLCLPTQVNSAQREMILQIQAPLYCDRPASSSSSSSSSLFSLGDDEAVQMPLDLSCRPRMKRHYLNKIVHIYFLS